MFNLAFGKILKLFLKIMHVIGPIFIVVNSQILSKKSSYLVTLVSIYYFHSGPFIEANLSLSLSDIEKVCSNIPPTLFEQDLDLISFQFCILYTFDVVVVAAVIVVVAVSVTMLGELSLLGQKKIFGPFWKVYLLFGKIFYQLWQNFNAIG